MTFLWSVPETHRFAEIRYGMSSVFASRYSDQLTTTKFAFSHQPSSW
jgi:hypothetical protein